MALNGYKSWIAGIAAILTGLGMIGGTIATKGFDFNSIYQGVLVVIGGLATLGVAGKLQKLLDEMKNGQ